MEVFSMSISSTALNDLSPLVLRLPKIIGRQAHLEAIHQAIADQSGRSYILYFVGPGGIGKTRLLEEVKNIRREWTLAPFLWSNIVDLYHAEHHSPSGLRQAIVNGLDPSKRYFWDYRQKREEFEQKRIAGVTGSELERLRRELDIVFQQDYAVLAEKHRLVLCFDTLELLQYESDTVQEICQVEDVETVIKNWLLEQVSLFPNTVTLFAGRPRPKIQAAFAQRFNQIDCVFELFELIAFTEEETQAYLEAATEQRPQLAEIITSELQKKITRITQGHPIYLAILIDLLVPGERDILNQIFPVFVRTSQKESEEAIGEVGKCLVQHLLDMPDPFGQIMCSLVHARKGLDAELLRYLLGRHQLGTSWSQAELDSMLAGMRQYAFVKTRPEPASITGQLPPINGKLVEPLFLHDEIYDLFDRYLRDDRRYADEFKFIVQYYNQQYEAATSSQEREELIGLLLYYELQVNPQTGYHQHYTRWDEEAIKNHETGFDMRLRDEVLLFLDRYTDPTSRLYNQLVANQIDRAAIDRDCALRWVKRYLARGDFKKARQVAENLRSSKEPIFDWEIVEDPLYKAGLLTVWGEAMLYMGEAEAQVRSTLEEAITLLENYQTQDQNQRWWRARILGRAYNNMGYSYWMRGRYGLALQEFRRALPQFTETKILDEQASTRTNLAFLLALLGRVEDALSHIKQALEIRQQIGGRYSIALSLNTRGIIRTLADHPIWALRDCQEALNICEQLDEPRGIGLAYNALGLTYRKRGDQWKQEVYAQEEADQFFRDAERCIQQAVDIFSKKVPEPFRLWEAYNELGSLYCDWGWLTRQRHEGDWTILGQAALEQYTQAIAYQDKALDIAIEKDLQFQLVDSYDDLAQVYGDQSFLLRQMGQLEEARKSREKAVSYLEEIEKRVPEDFHLVSGQGFRETAEPGEAYWLTLGKAYLWRSIWAFRDLLEPSIVPDQQRDEALRQAIRNLLLAIAYFQRFWPASYAFRHTLDYFSDFLQQVGVSVEWVREQVRNVAEEYQLDLRVVEETIDNRLGV
jgi:tetratricopeptide (TPR) repeat protein